MLVLSFQIAPTLYYVIFVLVFIYLLTIILTFVISIVQVPVLYETSIRPRVLAAGLQQDDALKGTHSVTAGKQSCL